LATLAAGVDFPEAVELLERGQFDTEGGLWSLWPIFGFFLDDPRQEAA